jgi:predicted transcriptional regulator of viral defense system
VTLPAPNYPERQLVRHVWRSADRFDVAASYSSNGYLSHGSAVFIHGLNDELPRNLYVNVEQSVKPRSGLPNLSQASIDSAFRRKQRRSSLIYEAHDYSITILSGKNTGRLEVDDVQHGKSTVAATSPERTLIDITVRPSYAGGVFKVAEAFERARSEISVSILLATLRKLNYVYPYHQAIGYYMEEAGYEERHLTRFRDMGQEYDFYLAHHMKDPEYIEKWRLFVPSPS